MTWIAGKRAESPAPFRIGTAGWSIPRTSAFRVDPSGTHLQRYARRCSCVEINSCFYRPHRFKTYTRWRESTPPAFRFSLKLPRAITHELKLTHARAPLEEFLEQTSGLAEKRGPMLVQLPPSFVFDPDVASTFFETVRSVYGGPIVFEPRHATWFTREVDALLTDQRVSRVAADPAIVPAAAVPGGLDTLVYYRLHGSPRTYWSRYDTAYIDALADRLSALCATREVWCVFDNTAMGAALENALELQDRLAGQP